MGSGIFIRDSLGRWISGMSCNWVSGGSLQADLLATEVGLEHVWSLGFENIICELDCLEVVNIITYDSSIDDHWFREVITRIRHMLQLLELS
jgi:hypothetical protein